MMPSPRASVILCALVAASVALTEGMGFAWSALAIAAAVGIGTISVGRGARATLAPLAFLLAFVAIAAWAPTLARALN